MCKIIIEISEGNCCEKYGIEGRGFQISSIAFRRVSSAGYGSYRWPLEN